MELSEKVKSVHEKLGELQDTGMPYLTYCRNQSWNGEPCDQCGSTEKPSKVKGRYIAGDYEGEGVILRICGVCVDKLEDYFMMEIE